MVDLAALINSSSSSSVGGSQLQAGQRRSTAGGAGGTGAEGAAGQAAVSSSSSWSLPGVIGPLWGLHMKVCTCVDCTQCQDTAKGSVVCSAISAANA